MDSTHQSIWLAYDAKTLRFHQAWLAGKYTIFVGWFSYWNPISSGFPSATFHYRRSGGCASSNIEQPPISAPDSPGFAARPPNASARTVGSARWLSTHAGRRPWRGDGRGQRQSGWGKTSANQGGSNWWMMVEWWLNDGWMMVEWWLNDGWMVDDWDYTILYILGLSLNYWWMMVIQLYPHHGMIMIDHKGR